MKILKNKKALATGIIAIMSVMFISALMSLIALVMAQQFTDTLNAVSNETISPEVKQQIEDNTGFMFWGDKIFVILFVVLLAAYLISSMTLDVNQPIFFILFVFVLILTTVLSMWLSNAWTYVLQDPLLSRAVENLKYTDYFMRYFPFITFLIGLSGALIFYARKSAGFSRGAAGETGGIE